MQAAQLQAGRRAAGDPDGSRWAPAKDRVYDYVRKAILEGRLEGGTFLEEERVSLAVGVSRTPVREAFQQLQSEPLCARLRCRNCWRCTRHG